ncbi:MAG: hypothetical protein IIA45_05950 [Bacteroidetes bacterium]|nr:hypothetical protein [Bacteroidota bacterium]
MGQFHLGGEPYYSPFLILEKDKFDYKTYFKEKYPSYLPTYTHGGYYSIRLIVKHILDEVKNTKILVPAYTCPTVLDAIKSENIDYGFYNVNDKLEIDIQDLSSKLSVNVNAILFINYFGFPQSDATYDLLNEQKQKGIRIIEDNVQSCFSDLAPVGDYIFNSFRKFTPFDGSVIMSKKAMENSRGTNSKYNFNKRIGQWLRYLNYHSIFTTDKSAQRFLSISSRNYYSDNILGFNSSNRTMIKKLNIQDQNTQRKNNFKILSEHFSSYAFYGNLPDNIVPLVFPISIDNRNDVRNELMKHKIFCPVHWNLPEEINEKDYPSCVNLSKRILSIPINGKIDEEVIAIIKSSIEKYN